jgi:hypothetical protein
LNTSSPESPSKTPISNAKTGRFALNGMVGQYIFETIEEAQDQATQLLWTYNNERPTIDIGIGGMTWGSARSGRKRSSGSFLHHSTLW